MSKSLGIFLVWFVINNGMTQSDYVVNYCEKQAVLYSHCYAFTKQDSNSSDGTFTHHFSPDHDGEYIGKGTFAETKRFFILKYDPPLFKDTLIYNHNDLHPDTIYIKWLNLWGEIQYDLLTVQVFDSLSKNSFSYTKITPYPWVAKIPCDSSGFTKKRITIKGMFIEELELKIPDGMNEITIVRNKKFDRVIYCSKKVKLHKRDNGNGLRDQNRKLFVKEKS